MSEKIEKTNAMRMLDAKGIAYSVAVRELPAAPGRHASEKPAWYEDRVFKTLVTQGQTGQYHVFVLSVTEELDLKKAARAAGEKNVAMIPVAEINKVTGYYKGGCSPVGMKKQFPTHLDEAALLFDRIFVSAGKIGMQLEIAPEDLLAASGAVLCDVTVRGE